MDQSQIQKFTELLAALMSQDNNIRNMAEQQYATTKKEDPNLLAVALVTCACGPFDFAVKQEACVLLRQNMRVLNQKDFLYNSVNTEVQSAIRTNLVSALENETNKAVRNRICDVVGELGSYLLLDEKANKWPELQPKLFQLLSTGNSAQRESGLRVLRDLIPTIGINLIKSHKDSFMHVLRVAMEDETSVGNRSQAVLIVCSIAENLPARFWKPFQQSFGQPMLKVIKSICDSGNEDEVRDCLEALIGVIEEESLFFKPFLGDLIGLCFQIANGKDDLEDGTRQLAFELVISLAEKKSKLCVKIPNFVQLAIRTSMSFMLEMEDSDVAQWAARFSDTDGDEATNYDIGEENVDRFAQALGGDVVLPVVFAIVGEFIRGDWQHKVAAIMTLSQCAEVIEDEAHTDAIVQLLLEQISDPHPRVRYAALHALGQSSTDCAPHIQEAWHEQILPALTRAIDDPVLRVGSHACAAFVNFAEECDVDVLLPHVDVLMEKLFTRLSPSNLRQVRENAITAIAVIAGVSEKHFVKFYPHVMPLLKEIVLGAVSKEERTLRGKAFECLSLLGIAVGKETFAPDAMEAMGAIVTLQQQNQLDDEEGTLKSFVYESLQRICKVLGTDFARFLPAVLPPLLAAFRVVPEEVSSPEEQQDMTLMMLGNQKCVGLKTSHIEDLQSALTTVSSFIELMGGAGYKDFIKETALRLMPLLEFQFDDEVKSLAITTWGHLVKCASEVGEVALAKDLTKGYFDYAKKTMPHEEDLDILEVQARGVSSCVSAALPGSIDAVVGGEIIALVFSLLEESFKRRKEQETELEEEEMDEDDLENAEVEKEKDESVRIALVEIGASMMKQHKTVFLQVGMVLFSNLVAKLIVASNNVKDRSLALYVACDFLENLGSDSVPAWPLFMDALFTSVTDAEVQLRQAACYGVNVAARIAEFGSVAPQAVQRLLMTIEQPNSKSKTNLMATENAVAALGHVCEKHAQVLGADVPKVWQTWLSRLPLKEDEDEGQSTHAQLLRLVQAQNPQVLGENNANLAKILHVLVQVYKRDTCSDITSNGIAKTLAAIPETTLEQILNSLPEKDKKKAVRIVQDVRTGTIGQ